jgi:hypothetical protein
LRSDLHQARQMFRSEDSHIKALKRVMENAPEMLKARVSTTLLNEYSMITRPDSGESSHQITLAHITLGEENSREALLVRFKPSDFT